MDRYWADLHVHTQVSSDCTMGFHEILEAAKSKGLNALAVTDHGTMGGVQTMQALSEDYGIEVIPGIEINTGPRGQHIVALDIYNPIKNGLGIAKTLKEIDRQDGLAIIAHPFRKERYRNLGQVENYLLEVRKLVDSYIFGVECLGMNHWTQDVFWYNRASDFAEYYNLPVIGSSDAHTADRVGLALSSCNGNSFSDFRKAFKCAKITPLGYANC